MQDFDAIKLMKFGTTWSPGVSFPAREARPGIQGKCNKALDFPLARE